MLRVRTATKQLRRKLSYDTDHPAHIFSEPRFGYRMEQGGDDGTRDGAVTFEDYTGSVGSVGLSPCGEHPAKPPLPSCLRGGAATIIGAVMPSRPLVECGVAAPDEMEEPPTLAGRRLVG